MPGALEQVRAWLPEHGEAALAGEAARLIHARQHGAPDWTAFPPTWTRTGGRGTKEDLFLQTFQAMEAARGTACCAAPDPTPSSAARAGPTAARS